MRYGSKLFGLLLAITIALTSACQHRHTLKLRHLRGFVPATRNIFESARMAVAPPSGLAAIAEHQVGMVCRADGKIESELYATNLESLLVAALVTQLRDSGLDAFALAVPAGGERAVGADFVLTTDLEQFQVIKSIGHFFVVGDCARCHTEPVKPVLDRYFTMRSRVRLRFTVRDRNGLTLYTGSIAGSEDEPPPRMPGESFLPLETEPGESLSVALSRAVGTLVLDPALRQVLRAAPTPGQMH